MVHLLGTDRARRLETSAAWPALASLIDRSIQRGWRIEDLLRPVARSHDPSGSSDMDECEATLWRVGTPMRPRLAEDTDHELMPDHEPALQRGIPAVPANPDPPPMAVLDEPQSARTWMPELGIDEPATPAAARHEEPAPLLRHRQDRHGPGLSL